MYRLRELERRDLAEINKWRNDPELIRNLGAPFRYINYQKTARKPLALAMVMNGLYSLVLL